MDLDKFLEKDILRFLNGKMEKKDKGVVNREEEYGLYLTKDYIKEMNIALEHDEFTKAKKLFDELKAIYNKLPEDSRIRKKVYAMLEQMYNSITRYIGQRKGLFPSGHSEETSASKSAPDNKALAEKSIGEQKQRRQADIEELRHAAKAITKQLEELKKALEEFRKDLEDAKIGISRIKKMTPLSEKKIHSVNDELSHSLSRLDQHSEKLQKSLGSALGNGMDIKNNPIITQYKEFTALAEAANLEIQKDADTVLREISALQDMTDENQELIQALGRQLPLALDIKSKAADDNEVSRRQIEEWYAEGIYNMFQRDYAAACRYFGKIVQSRPNNKAARIRLQQCEEALGNV